MTRQDRFPLNRIEAELAPDERVLWFGKPNAAYHAFYADVETSAALATTAITMSILLILTLLIGGDAWSIALLAMVVLGLAVSVQLSASYLDARSTRYAITNKRILVLRGEYLNSYDAIDFIEATGNADYGTVIFQRKTATKLVPIGYSVAEHIYVTDVGFHSIEDPAHVISLLASVFKLPASAIRNTITQPQKLRPVRQAS